MRVKNKRRRRRRGERERGRGSRGRRQLNPENADHMARLLVITLFVLWLIIIAIQYLMIYTLYHYNHFASLYIHMTISLLPSLLIYAFIAHEIKTTEFAMNPLLPIVILWNVVPSTNKSTLPNSKLYQRFTSCNICSSIFIFILIFVIIIPFISLFPQFLLPILFIVYFLRNENLNSIIQLQILYIVPCFIMYTCFLFAISDLNSYLVLLMIIYLLISIVYVSLYVIFTLSTQPSDLMVLTEFVLVLTTLFLSFLIDYVDNDVARSISFIMSIICFFTDGCFFKAIPVRNYTNYSKQFDVYQFRNDDKTQLIDKLYCIVHHKVYHTDFYNDDIVPNAHKKKGDYETILEIEEPHKINTIQCYDLQHQFYEMNDEQKKKHIDQLLLNHSLIKTHQCQTLFIYLYWIISFFVCLFPILWIIYVGIIDDSVPFDITTNYQHALVFSVFIIYIVLLLVTMRWIHDNYGQFQVISILQHIEIDNIKNHAKSILKMHGKMKTAVAVVNCIQIDIAFVILLYVYGTKE